MKKVFIIAAFAGLVSCGHDDCCEKPIIVGEQFDFTQDEGVSDSLVYGEWEPVDSTDMFGPFLPGEIDSLETVNELLDYLETIPGYQYPEGPLTDRQ